jgi:hypothetical protein
VQGRRGHVERQKKFRRNTLPDPSALQRPVHVGVMYTVGVAVIAICAASLVLVFFVSKEW